MVETEKIDVSTRGGGEIVNITDDLRRIVSALDEPSSGIVTVFVPGATGGLTTIEDEPGLRKDWPALMEKLVPADRAYEHDRTWHDGNGHSHLRAALIGPSITIPFVSRELTLGTWQSVVFIDFDNRPRNRNLVVQVVG